MGLAVVAAVSAISVNVFAETSFSDMNAAAYDTKIDYDDYDSDLVYIPEHAAMADAIRCILTASILQAYKTHL